MKRFDKLETLSEVALGRLAPDTLVLNGTLFNAFTGEFVERQALWIKEGMIAYVGPDHDPPRDEKTETIDAQGMVLLPGLIDGHTHLNRTGIEEFTRYVVPSGTTTVVLETQEVAMISGRRGLEHFVRGLAKQPIRFLYTVAPVCGLTPSTEINALSTEELLPFLKDPFCVGVGEIYWGNIFLEGEQGERVRQLVRLALSLGKSVEGHSAGASEKKLQAYTCWGVSSCHEPITEEEVLARLRLGFWVMVREGSVRRELEAVQGLFKKNLDLRRLVLATDGIDPERFMEAGSLDAAVRTAIELGASPFEVYQMVTLNVAEHFGLDPWIGSLAPGRMADLVVIPRPEEFSPQLVMREGKTIFHDGKALVEPQKVFLPDDLLDTVHVQDVNPNFPPPTGKVRVIELVSRLVTKERIVDLRDPEQRRDVLMVLASERLGRNKAFMGLLKGLGLQRGAYASTMTWDTVDMLVVGVDPESMKTAMNRVKEIRGGGVYAIGREVIAEFSAPFCGGLPLEPMETLYKKMKRLNGALNENGIPWEKPILTLDTLTSPAIPHLRITHEGYVRLRDREILPLEA